MEALETQAQATQEKENAVTKQNMKYTMSSSRGIYLADGKDLQHNSC